MTNTNDAPSRQSEHVLKSADGHLWQLLACIPEAPRAQLLWLPALGIAARHYLPFAETLAAQGVATFIHEWRGNGSSSLRASRTSNWGYRELLFDDLPISVNHAHATCPAVPAIIGGHSLGGQFACFYLGLNPESAERLWLVASGSPYWRTFPRPARWWLPSIYRFLPWLADRAGALPGRRVGFGGNEARGVMRDWSGTALTGHYAAHGITNDLEAALAELEVVVDAVLLHNDWLVPRRSLDFLLGKMSKSASKISIVSEYALGTRADHFAWMKRPNAITDALLAGTSSATESPTAST